MKKAFYVCFSLIFTSCSLLPPSLENFKDDLKATIGHNIYDKDMWLYNSPNKVIQIHKTKKWYYLDEQSQCKFILFSDLNNTIYDYKIVTPERCKIGYSAAW